LLTQLVGYNFDANVPTFQMISPEEDQEQKAKILKILLDAGAVDPSEEWVRDYLDVPQRNQPYIRKFQDTIKTGKPVIDLTLPEPFPFRPLTEYEKAIQINYAETKFFLTKWVDEISEKVSDILFKQLAQVIPQVKEYFQNKDYRGIRNLYLDTKEAETEMENQFAEVYLLSMATAVNEIERSIGQTLTFKETFQETYAPTPSERLKQFIGRVPITKEEWKKLVSSFKSKAFTVAGFIERDIVSQIQRIVYRAIDEDWFINDLVKAIEKAQIQYTGKAWTLPPGTPMEKYHTKLVFRNAISDIYNGARRDLYFDPDVEDYVPALQYSAVMDERTRQTHREMDGRIYLKSDPIWEIWFPPSGHNCRCTVIPVTSNLNYQISSPVPASLRPDAGFSKESLI
ncbi:MAG: minor capsid protein, partial [Pseudomonadota bacterium]